MDHQKLIKFSRRALIAVLLLGLFSPLTKVHAQIPRQSSVVVTFFSISGASLDELLAGNTGDGLLLYSVSEIGDLRLAVRLTNPGGADGSAYARVYEIPADLQSQAPSASILQALDDLTPKVILQSPDGRWVSDGKADYNLDISIYGPAYAMWGAGYDSSSGFKGWAARVAPGELSVKIQVRDTDADGIPDWELRQLVPAFPGRGYLRTNYTERKCDTPTEVDLGVSPAWSFVATGGGYEQATGIFRPPIVVDWATGKITHFSELVTARNQNCSYTIYSLKSLERNQTNALDFEAPFAFYDLSGAGVGYPNLILRTERYPESDPYMSQTEQGFEQVRYSWRDGLGDRLWDYKVEVLGFHPYSSQTAIAAGQYLIDTPDYDEFPGWVMSKPWPLVTFVDTEGNSTRSSEGIYDWSPRSFSIDYFTGNISAPHLDEFQAISEGLRGEYRFGEPAMVRLYFSPIDGRLHLEGAQAGLFNLDGEQQMRLYNLDGDDYLDGWTRERIPTGSSSAAVIQEGLFKLGNRILYFSPDQLRIYSFELEDNQLELTPPTDAASWQHFKQVMSESSTIRKDPLNLSSWMDGVGEEVLRVSGAQAGLPKYQAGIYSLHIHLEPDSQLQGEQVIGIDQLSSGDYLVTYDGASFHSEPLTPARISLTITSQPADHAPISNLFRLSLRATNDGMADSTELDTHLLADCRGETTELLHQSTRVASLGAQTWDLDWQPTPGQSCKLVAGMFDPSGVMISSAVLDLAIPPAEHSLSEEVLAKSTQDYISVPAFSFLIVLSLVAGGVTYGLFRHHRSTFDGH